MLPKRHSVQRGTVILIRYAWSRLGRRNVPLPVICVPLPLYHSPKQCFVGVLKSRKPWREHLCSAGLHIGTPLHPKFTLSFRQALSVYWHDLPVLDAVNRMALRMAIPEDSLPTWDVKYCTLRCCGSDSSIQMTTLVCVCDNERI